MVTRRGFLGAMLAACAAPAIVRSESLMKIIVPKKEIIRLDTFIEGAPSGDFTVEMWAHPNGKSDAEWKHLALTQRVDQFGNHHIQTYVNGVIVSAKEVQDIGWQKITTNKKPNLFDAIKVEVKEVGFPAVVNNLKITKGYARGPDSMLLTLEA